MDQLAVITYSPCRLCRKVVPSIARRSYPLCMDAARRILGHHSESEYSIEGSCDVSCRRGIRSKRSVERLHAPCMHIAHGHVILCRSGWSSIPPGWLLDLVVVTLTLANGRAPNSRWGQRKIDSLPESPRPESLRVPSVATNGQGKKTSAAASEAFIHSLPCKRRSLWCEHVM